MHGLREAWSSQAAGGGEEPGPAGSPGPGHSPWASGPALNLLTEDLTELTVLPSLLGGVGGRVPAHLQEKPRQEPAVQSSLDRGPCTHGLLCPAGALALPLTG